MTQDGRPNDDLDSPQDHVAAGRCSLDGALRELALAIAEHLDRGSDLITLLRLARQAHPAADPDCLADAFLLAHGLLAGVAAPAPGFCTIWGAEPLRDAAAAAARTLAAR
ncbi:hypothetical protein [Nocardioides sp. URHA0032]|uniref:hypothetical protein n=1 Tax=Nocardioides sp. URHA0032 TaxID=1380388 RepID=UPI00048F026A|nr:hypothetical protein [Nocardioides sp. URHA0032]